MSFSDWWKSRLGRSSKRPQDDGDFSDPNANISRENEDLKSLLLQFDGEIHSLLGTNQREPAERCCQRHAEVLSNWTSKAASGRIRDLLAAGYFDLASSFRLLRKRNEAERHYAQAEILWRRLSEEEPNNTRFLGQIAGCRNHLGLLYLDETEFAQASEQFQMALTIRKELAARFPHDELNIVYLGGAMCNLGNAAGELEDFDTAMDWLNQSINLLDQSIPGCDCGCRDMLANMAAQLGSGPSPVLVAEQFLKNALGSRRWVLEKSGRAERFVKLHCEDRQQHTIARVLTPRLALSEDASPEEAAAFQELRCELLDIVSCGNFRVVIDLSDVTELDARGAALLLHLRGRLIGMGEPAVLCGLSDSVLRAHPSIRWKEQFELYSTVDEAVGTGAE